MKTIETQILINARPPEVWDRLMAFQDYPNWNPFILEITGEPAVRNKIRATIKPPQSKPMVFKPVVLKNQKATEFRWKGKLAISGLFDGEHYFILEKSKNGSTLFTQGEHFNGLLVPLMPGMFKKTEQGFKAMNQALKEVCEKASQPK